MQVITFAKAVAPPALAAAWLRVRANRGAAGVDRVSIADFEPHAHAAIATLSEQLADNRYRPEPLRRVEFAPAGRKARILAIPTVRDRIAQTAVKQALTPLAEAMFSDSSFGYRPGRCVAGALEKVLGEINSGKSWIVDADIRKFFDSIPRRGLVSVIERWIADPRLLALARAWVGRVDGQSCGIAQGSPLSPLLANIYLHQLDEAFEREGVVSVRYADDFVALCRSATEASRALALANDTLNGLGLELHPDKTRVVHAAEGFRFLGADIDSSGRYVSNLFSADCNNRRDRLSAPNTRDHRDIESTVKDPRRMPTCDENPLADEGQVRDEGQEHVSTIAPTGNAVRTLYLTEQLAMIQRDGERITVSVRNENRLSIPARKLDLVIAFGNVSFTTPAMHLLFCENVPVAFLSAAGVFLGVADSANTQAIALHQAQFEAMADRDRALAIAKRFVAGKLANGATVLRRYARRHAAAGLETHLTAIRQMRDQAGRASSLEMLRGCEGFGARSFYAGVRALLGADWGFDERNRRPPKDPVNALLSLGYTLLFQNVFSLAKARGLHPYAGFLHPPRAGHPALISDLMEEFRAPVVDALVLNLLLDGEFKRREFDNAADGACMLTADARKRFLHAFEAKMQSVVERDEEGEKLDFRRAIERQARRLAGVLRDRLREYRPYRIR